MVNSWVQEQFYSNQVKAHNISVKQICREVSAQFLTIKLESIKKITFLIRLFKKKK